MRTDTAIAPKDDIHVLLVHDGETTNSGLASLPLNSK
jgi:hypothetical protein